MVLLLVGVGLGGVDCTKQMPCRPGTVFVSVDLGGYTTATHLDVDVSVGGATPQHTTLPTGGARRGGVEVQFPGGYPGGDSVTIVVTLRQSTTPLAMRSVQIDLTDDCGSVDVDFGGVDGGGGGQGGRSGSSGGAGAGGAAGSAGVTGGAGAAGATGRGGAGGMAGGAGAAGGVAGAAGSVAGAGGVAGAAGRGGGGGAAGGIAGAPGRGGAGGGCVATTETCFNGRDDDCDGRIDCADSDCSPTVAHCVALDPSTGGRIGVMINAATACPTAYPDPMTVMQSLTPGTCSGCSCSRPSTACSTTVAAFDNAAACAGGTALPAVSLTPAMGCVKPDWNVSFYAFGIIAGAFTPTVSGTCLPSGTPVAGTPSWATNGRFCSTTAIGGGCNAGQVCVPNITTSPGRCQMYDGAHACPTGATSTAWYTGYSGTQGCSGCSCSVSAAASCAAMRINVGSDYTCAPPVGMISAGGQKVCFNQTYEPGVELVGTPTPPVCQGSSSPTAGTLTPTGLKTLCCLP
jgi:hypothetical protein